MRTTRRQFFIDSMLATVAVAAGCRSGTEIASQAPAYIPTSDRTVVQTLPGIPTTDGAGVRLTRVIGQPALRNLDPFVMLDRFHSDDPSAYIAGFPSHPHRGFETVTVMLDGRMQHRDSLGNSGVIQGGGSQWMTAGRGIIHSEMPVQEQGLMSGFQLWVNLPAKEKMCDPYYQDLGPEQLAESTLSSAGSKVRVISGRPNGLAGPVRERPTQPTLFTLTLEDDQPFALELPDEHVSFAFVYSGEIDFGPEAKTKTKTVRAGNLAVFSPGKRLRMRATNQRSAVLVGAAKPIREPIVQRGPFVMNTEAEIYRAIEDYRNGVLDKA
ncbi:pirin family protein [Archangium sp.]|uniref:pirin family protein n=1 Tax=Archangium sp. TaxID=1872627 RepID=UPI002D3E7DC3|nr:pirin family protein [Archangium sp.]HYO54592.1 pirin family protein [Archangium sp.]